MLKLNFWAIGSTAASLLATTAHANAEPISTALTLIGGAGFFGSGALTIAGLSVSAFLSAPIGYAVWQSKAPKAP